MKKWMMSLLCLLVLCSIFCSHELEKNILITGVIKNPKNNQIKIKLQSIPLDPDGQFRFVEKSDKSGYFDVDFGNQFALYLKPGDTIHLEVDAEQGLNGIKLTGDRLIINQFMVELAVESEKVNSNFSKNYQKIFILPEQNYINTINDLWKPLKEQFAEFKNESNQEDEHFIKTLQASILYSRANLLIRYPNWYRQFSGQSDYLPSEDYFKFLLELDLNDAALWEVEEYKEFLSSYLTIFSENMLKQTTRFENLNYKPYRAKMDVTLDTFSDPIIRSEMLYSFMSNLMSDYNHKGLDDLILLFRQNCTNPQYIKEIEKQISHDKAIRDKCTIQVFKSIDDVTLDVFLFSPSELEKGDKRAALAFFHGGGWESGKPEWGQMQCEHFSSLGLVCLSFQYRLTTQHDVTPVESIEDAKSAIRWIREHAEDLGIDPNRIVASGYSAGGHLAACTAMIAGFENPDEDHSISSKANAMMFWVTPFMVFKDGWFGQILKGKAKIEDCDPYTHVRPGLPPSIIFQGTEDDLVPVGSVKAFAKKMEEAGNRCDLHIYEGQTHLNWGDNNFDVLQKMEKFLESIGYLDL